MEASKEEPTEAPATEATEGMAATSVSPVDTQPGVTAAEGAVSGRLTFSEHMWDQFELLVMQRVEPSKRHLETFIAGLQDRAQAERAYGKSLARIANKAPAKPENQGVPALDAMTVSMRKRSEHAFRLADELEQDVAAMVGAVLQQHVDVFTRLFADGSRLIRHWQDACRSHDHHARRYALACTGAEDTARDCLEVSPVQPAEWRRAAERSVALARQASIVERDYCRAVQRVNAVAGIFGEQMRQILDALQDMEEKRGKCLRDAALKMAVYDTSWLRNMQYDLDSSVQAVESKDVMAEIQGFIREHQTQASPPSQTPMMAYWEIGGDMAQQSASASTVNQSATEEVHHEFQRDALPMVAQHEEVINSVLSSLFAKSEAGAETSVPKEEFEQLKQLLAPNDLGTTAPCRRALCNALQKQVQVNTVGSEAEQVPLLDLTAIKIGQESFDMMVSLVKVALDGCDFEGDAWNGRDLMVLAQKIQNQASEKGVVDVLLKVYSHPLWSRVSFWEDVLLVALSEAQALQALRRRSQAPPGTEYLEVATTPFLERYITFMAALGIKTPQARACVQRTLRKHAPLLGSATETYINLLNSTINEQRSAGGSASISLAASATDAAEKSPVGGSDVAGKSFAGGSASVQPAASATDVAEQSLPSAAAETASPAAPATAAATAEQDEDKDKADAQE